MRYTDFISYFLKYYTNAQENVKYRTIFLQSLLAILAISSVYPLAAAFASTTTAETISDNLHYDTNPSTIANDPPIANKDYALTDEGIPVTASILSNDIDPDGDPLTITEVTDPANGLVINNNNGTVTYVPDDDFLGTDIFQYTIVDGNGGIDTVIVIIIVIISDSSSEPPTNSSPEAINDAATTDENTAVVVPVLANDSDPDSDMISLLSVTDPPNGSATINGNGTVTYEPDLDFVGQDEFQYVISDGKGGVDSATVTVDVIANPPPPPANNPPDAVDDMTTTNYNTAISIDVTGNDSDPDGDALIIGNITSPSSGVVVNNGNGTLIYTPNPGFFGTDTFSYTISDGSSGTDSALVTVSVSPPRNSPPNAVDDSAVTDEGVSITVNVLANDSDPDGDPLDIDSVTNPGNGSAIRNENSTITYTPNPGFIGTDVLNYVLSDGKGGNDTATMTIVVNDVISELFCGRVIDDFDNVLFGTNVGEILRGTEDDDLIRGWGGDDTIYGKGGNDCLKGDDGNDMIWGGQGDDVLRGGAGEDKLVGDVGNDTLNGHAGNDRIWGSEGDDILLGEIGADLLVGDSGNDTIWGGDDDDKILGEEGNDAMYGDSGNDKIYGHAGDDSLWGGGNDDAMVGGAGNDMLTGDSGEDGMWGGDDDDKLFGSAGNDKLVGDAGNDKLYGQEGDDKSFGSTGNDYHDGGANYDKCHDTIGTNAVIHCEE